jgi:hypothetical protein
MITITNLKMVWQILKIFINYLLKKQSVIPFDLIIIHSILLIIEKFIQK